MESTPAQCIVRFGTFEVNLRSRELRKHGLRIKLQDQPFRVLELLLEHPGQLITREEFQRQIWPADTFVDFELGLNTAVKRLRQALGDYPENPRFVETLPRRGYRFVFPVNGDSAPPSEAAGVAAISHPGVESSGTGSISEPFAPATKVGHRSRRNAVVLSILLIALAAEGAYLAARHRRTVTASGRIRSIAVLPLENLSADPQQEYFADGMTDELITSLAKLQTLKVISRSSVVRYKGTSKPLPEIARELNVDGIIEGTVLRSGSRVRITAQLIRAATDQHLWAETYEGNMEDVLRLQDAVARAVAAEIRFKLGPEAEARLAKSPSVNAAAYEAYLRGRYHLYDRWTEAGFVAASRYFEEAIARDPQYAPPYAGLADYYTFRDFPFPNREVIEKAKELAAKALQLDDGLAEAHTAMANLLFRYDWNWAEAEKEFRRGIELNPNAPSSYLHYAMYLGALGRHDEAIAAMKRAIELDPFSALMNSALGIVLEWSGRYDEAAEQERKTIALDPYFPQPHEILADAYDQLRKYDEAIVEHLATDTLEGVDPSVVADFKRAYVASGINGYRQKRLEWEKQRPRTGRANYFLIAKLSAELGDTNVAFQWLEKAYQERLETMPNIKVAPGLRSLHGDPRFADLVRRVGLT